MYEGTLYQLFLTKSTFYKVFLCVVSMYLSYPKPFKKFLNIGSFKHRQTRSHPKKPCKKI